MIVDDVPANIMILNALLSKEYRTLVATSGRRALELAFAENPPQLILLDVVMPEMDGYQVCQVLKADPRTQAIPVLFVTGQADLEVETRAFAAGCADLLSKPISPPILYARVATHLELAEARRRSTPAGLAQSQID